MGDLKSFEPGRGRLWIVVGLSIAALAVILFALILATQRDDRTMSTPNPPLTQSTSYQRTSLSEPPGTTAERPVPTEPGPNLTTLPLVPDDGPSDADADSPIRSPTVTAQTPATVTVQAPPPPTASANGGFFNSVAATVGAITTLVIALTGLITAATGLIKVLRTRGAAAGSSHT
ncbi:hypothetical protein [Mycobacterium sp. GA-2829]|uniref:hypothetical protein n=1 Tax=Mycobacterium sp. GA-2829 TaxID=1772283 RepID=UPI0012FB5A35|nr:hypothetical protein [Mycobacterium sp. GA-2829]